MVELNVSYAATLADLLLTTLKDGQRDMWLGSQAVNDLTRLAKESPRHWTPDKEPS